MVGIIEKDVKCEDIIKEFMSKYSKDVKEKIG